MPGYIGESHRFSGGKKWNGSAWGTWPFDAEQVPWRLNYDGLSHAISAGADYIIGAIWDGNLFAEFMADATVQAYWVIEVDGGSGTLQLDGGVDPGWVWNDTTLASQSLGSYSVTGATTIVTPAVTAATPTVLHDNDDSVILRLRCTSGTIDIRQVKLRTWGDASPGGAWTAGSTFTIPNVAATIRAAGTGWQETGPFATEADAYEPTKELVDAQENTTQLFTASNVGGGDFLTFFRSDLGDGYGGQAQFTVCEVSAQPFPITQAIVSSFSPHAATAGIDPREVRQEPLGGVRVGGVAPVSHWLSWNSGQKITATASGTRIAWQGIDVPTYGVGGAKALIIPQDGAFYVDTGPIGMDFPTFAAFAFTVVPDTYLSFIGGSGGGQAEVPSGSLYTAEASGYEYFDVTMPWAQPRFFVKDLAGTWRPVGFGKPAAEAAVFKVPTAAGMYRDLTSAEYASYGPSSRPPDGYPLKVKRHDDDGTEWWDHVAWMVPDA